MKACPQTETQSVYQHGESVQERALQLYRYLAGQDLIGEWRIPDWVLTYKDNIFSRLLSQEIIMEYTLYHDCGKPYCIFFDHEGKKHFPNHTEVSYQTWINIGGSLDVAKLIRMDMMIHQIKAKDIDSFIQNKEAVTLMIVGLAEIHSNASMFGGLESESFKIKWKQINNRGKIICKNIFEKSK